MTLVIAHRGASGHAYENSPAAFRLAVELGADAVELDVHASRDGVLLVHHDAAVPGIGPIHRLPASAFAGYRLPNGEAIPTLAEALRLLDGLDVMVELKSLSVGSDAALLATLQAGPTPQRYAVHAFDHRIIARLGEQCPELRRGLLLSSYLLDPIHALTGAGADTLWMATDLVDGDLVAELHEHGLDLVAWTANDELEISRLAALGVDGICGNFPDRIHGIVGQTRDR